MPKEQSNYPGFLDNLIVDRQSGQVVPSDAFDVIEDAITQIEAELRRVATKTEAATLTASEGGLIVCTSSANYTLGLPPAAINTGLLYFIIKTDNNSYTITLDANAGETIGGALTYTDLSYQWAYVAIKSDGANWQIIARSRLVAQSIHFQDLRAADDDYIHEQIIGTDSEQEITTGITNPDVPRNASVKTTNISSPSGVVKITGIDSKGKSAEDGITIIPDGTAYGVVAFATISMITVPPILNDYVTIGMSDKLGLGSPIIKVGDVFKKKANNEDKSSEITDNVDTTYDTLNCETIIENMEITIWFKGRV